MSGRRVFIRPGRRLSRRGSALLYVIASIALLGAVGGGVAYFSSSSSTSQLTQSRAEQAYYAATGGKNYAEQLTEAEFEALENSTAHYTLTNGVEFDLTVGTKSGIQYPVTVLGTVNSGTSLASNFQLGPVPITPKDTTHVTLPGSTGSTPFSVGGAQSIFGNDAANNLIDVVTEGDPSYNGETYIRLGYNALSGLYGSACIWHNGSLGLFDVSDYCENGKCEFGSGIRVYFEFQYHNTFLVDNGFTFSLINGSNNSITDCGGNVGNIFTKPTGELMAYAGPGASGFGLRPPKIAIEFDTLRNFTSSCTDLSSRNDDDFSHIAYVYWGAISPPCRTFDDNIHGAGNVQNDGQYTIDGERFSGSPVNNDLYNTNNIFNSKYKTGNDITYKSVSNMSNGAVHTFRMEVTRSTNPDGSGSYTLKSWLDCNVGGQPCAGISTVSKDFNASIKSPDLVTTVTMDEYFHDLFKTFVFGFTEGTGLAVQEVRIKNFRLNFKK